jgi:2-C-methyl-D-erythritol 4-phosphate cytidylyltransferase/2-C-methyl-D-erythritol 2,4-cyclodiphosphate synthase
MSMRTAAIIPAAGSGSRMAADRPKQFLKIGHDPILVRTLRHILAHKAITLCIVPLPEKYHIELQNLCRERLTPESLQKIQWIEGGATRQESVHAGLRQVPKGYDLIMVHDGARPLVKLDLISRCLEAAATHGAAIAAIRVKDTLKKVNEYDRTILNTVERENLWQAQTPQVARRNLLNEAYELASAKQFIGTDEASLLEYAGIEVQVVEGDEHNLKITRPGDLNLANKLIQPEGERGKSMRIGNGFDVHRLVAGRELILGGVRVDHPLGLLGHSDADVLTHALMDAVLGAAGLGDIGLHFPDSDNTFKGASSLQLLAEVMQMIDALHFQLVNVDCTIVCQQPKLRPYIDAIQHKLANTCHVKKQAINIKATTTEKLGFTGRGEGIAAHAVALLTIFPPHE